MSEGLLLECSVGYLELRRLKLNHTWQLTACLLQSSTAGCPQAVQISITTVVITESGRVRTVRAMNINIRNSAQVMILV